MSKRTRLLGTFLILALMVALVSIVPLTAATAGTVTLTGGVTNQSIRWYSATADAVPSVPTANQVATIQVADADKNILTELPGTCTSGTMSAFKCEILANPAAGTGVDYTTRNTNLEDANLDDIPDNVLIRGLQEANTGWITSGTVASTGTIKLTSALLRGKFGVMAGPSAVAAAILPTAPTTALTNKAQVQVIITLNAGGTLGANGIKVVGTSINPTTMVETAADSEIIVAAGAVANGTYVSTKFWSSITTFEVAWTAGAFTFELDENYTVAARYKYNNVDTITARTTVTSSAHAVPLDVNLTETGPGTGIFNIGVVLTSNLSDHGKTGNQIFVGAARGVSVDRGTGTHTGAANSPTLTPSALPGGTVVGDVVVNSTDGSLGIITSLAGGVVTATLTGGTENDWDVGDTFKIGVSDVRKRLYVNNATLITGTYRDEDPSATITGTARVDLSAPTITLVGPATGSFSNVSAQTLTVQVIDPVVADGAASGLATADINTIVATAPGGATGTTSPDLPALLVGTNALQIAYSLTLTGEGQVKWWVPVRDQVGNFAKFTNTATPPDNNAIPGAGDPAQITVAAGTAGQTAPDNPFKITIDTVAPSYVSGETGGRLAVAADVTAGPPAIALNDWLASATSRKNVTVKYGLGTGKAPLNADTVATSDFRIAGVTPVSVAVSNVDTTTNVQYIVLTLGADQATDAAPLVEVVSTMADKAGNSTTTITSSTTPAAVAASDKLSPILTVSITGQAASQPVANGDVTINVTSTESGNIAGSLADLTTDVDGTAKENTTKTPTFSLIGTNTWKATVGIGSATNPYGVNMRGIVNVRVSVTDNLSNVGTAGKADPDSTVAAGGVAGTWVSGALLFEYDNWTNNGAAPTFTLAPNIGTLLAPKADVPSPFVRIDFNAEATEYPVGAIAVDSHKKMTLTSATLLKPGATSADDVLAMVKAVDDNSFVLATSSLAVGDYKLSVQGKDEVGNISNVAGATTAATYTYTFTVTTKALWQLDVIPGMNLVSLPMDPVSTAIADVFGATTEIDLVVTYDPNDKTGPWLIAQRGADGKFAGTLTNVDAKHGYWVRATSYATKKLDLPRQQYQQQVPVIPAVAGWNLVPVVDLAQQVQGTAVDEDAYFANISWNVCYTFNTMNNAWIRIQKGAAGFNMAVGSAYWVWATAAGNIVP